MTTLSPIFSMTTGPFSARRLARTFSSVSPGSGAPYCFSASRPTSAKSQSHLTPAPSMTRIAASQISGPTPSPRMTVILCICFMRGRVSFFLQRLLDRAFGQRRHDLVTFGVRVQAVVGQFRFEHSFVIDHLAEVVQVDVPL